MALQQLAMSLQQSATSHCSNQQRHSNNQQGHCSNQQRHSNNQQRHSNNRQGRCSNQQRHCSNKQSYFICLQQPFINQKTSLQQQLNCSPHGIVTIVSYLYSMSSLATPTRRVGCYLIGHWSFLLFARQFGQLCLGLLVKHQ